MTLSDKRLKTRQAGQASKGAKVTRSVKIQPSLDKRGASRFEQTLQKRNLDAPKSSGASKSGAAKKKGK